MKDKTTHLYVDSHERTLILHSLVELKNALIRQGRYTDCIDELIFKVANAPVKKMKIEYVYGSDNGGLYQHWSVNGASLGYLSHSEQRKLVESRNGVTEQSRRSLKAEP